MNVERRTVDLAAYPDLVVVYPGRDVQAKAILLDEGLIDGELATGQRRGRRVVIRAHDATLENGEVAFNRVGVHVAANVLAGAMANEGSRAMARLHAAERLVIIRVECGAIFM